MRKLPDYPVRDAIPALQRALAEHGRAVLAAPPGSGKTTTVPLALLDEPWLRDQRIVMLEPRRVAARASAARMAQLMGEAVGETVGYQVRFDRRVSNATRIEVVTEGLLTRRLQSDAELPGVGLVIFDEFHERSLDADLALALTLDARANLRPELRVLVMSATLDTARVAALLDGAPVIEASGRMFPVDLRYLGQKPDARLDDAMASGVLRALAETRGDVLAFLPGAREIRGTQRQVESSAAAKDLVVRPLYGELSSAEQDLALAPDAQGRRKLILATNIAQTSLTVEGVTTVIDGGYVRAARFDLGAGSNRLDTLRVSRAAADQRAGRAGRLGPGVVYRLWSQDQQGALAAHDTPEILAADLTRFALELASWGAGDPAQLALLDRPSAANWNYARDLLLALGALDSAGRITPHGRALSRLPAAPRIAHLMLVARDRGLAQSGAWLAAALDERDPGGSTDLVERVARLAAGSPDPAQRRRVDETVRQTLRLLGEEPRSARSASTLDHDGLPVLVSVAFPERLARRREGLRELSSGGPRGAREVAFLCADGGEARLPENDPLARAEWLAIAHWDPGATRRIRLAASLDEAAVRAAHADRLVSHREVRWDAQQDIVVAEEQQRLGAIVLSARRIADAGEAGRTAMIAGIRRLGLGCLPWNESARQWQARVQSLRAWQPEGAWPDVSDDALLATLEDWLAPHLDGVTRRAHLDALNLPDIFNGMLDYAAQQQLQKLAPTQLTVPSGQRRGLSYAAGAPPTLEVKLQEMFGCLQTPTVCAGRVPVLLHLLSPGQRPVAVTQDLAGFWERGYIEVRKDLRGRYPRHPWPDDPRAAQATHRAKPRGT
ncbi:ATP-dependent helicase HrpB [Panacagrimonas perspica]|uniref:ATP-dependent helicase HrpB n=1 Tax=Panacagrimonas perspica TaxID=381431 RepID=A0A4R7P5J6_9GAMM|nr:ATP-dependent helicase HrpB [Panacagrimonas perspica]TDU28679.1 ATP-dependent helicase HrpB [Panacagrimonas perspica]THD05005.1 ATP-dependent helicase HrpB [Panacagrimonas perspica]